MDTNFIFEIDSKLVLKLLMIFTMASFAHLLHYLGLSSYKSGLRWMAQHWRAGLFLTIASSCVLIYSCKSGNLNPVYCILIPTLACLHFFQKPSQAEVSRVLEGPQDLGKQLAWWYYLGYLRPLFNSSDNSKSVEERMELYEEKEGVNLCCYKVVLLLPSSCYLSAKSPSWEECNLLPPNSTDRAGAPRTFNNTVYLLNPDYYLYKQRPMRAVVEYVTGLNVLYEMSSDSGKPMHPRLKQQHYLTFCQELEQLIGKDPLLQKGCLLVPYTDTEDVDVAAHLLHRLSELCQEELPVLPSAPEEPPT